jgi:hypothetical protein
MGEDARKAAAYVEFSVHHLEIAGLLPRGSELEQFQAHPLYARLATGWLAQDDSDVAAVDLFHLEEGLFRTWDEGRRAWVGEYISGLGLPSEACAQAVKIIEGADVRLAAGIAKMRARDLAVADKLEAARAEAAKVSVAELEVAKAEMARAISEAESIPWPNPEHARELAALLGEMAEPEAPLPYQQARDYAGISQEDAQSASDTLEKLAAVTTLQLVALEGLRHADPPSGPAQPEDPPGPTMSKGWQKLWDNPSKQAMSILSSVAVELSGLLGPHLLTEDELCASPQYQELIVRINVPVGSSPERYREKTLETLRSRPLSELPISGRTNAKVAEVLNRYFENWRLALEAESVASLVEAKPGGPKPS